MDEMAAPKKTAADVFDKEYCRILDRMRRLCSRREYCTADIYRKASAALSASLAKRRGHGDMISGSGIVCGHKVPEAAAKSVAMSESGMPDDAEIGKLAAGMIASLVGDKYLDDRRYACAFARDKASISGWGRLKIRNALAAKGLDRQTVEAALSEIDGTSADSRMEKVLEVKFRSLAKALRTGSSSASGSGKRSGNGISCRSGKDSTDGKDRYELKMKMLRFALGRGYGYEEAAPVIERLVSES